MEQDKFDPTRERGKVLIVDDEVMNIQILRELLKHDYFVYMADSGQKALENCVKIQPDVVLLDIMMPDMNGFDVCGSIKGNPETSHIPVIFITAHLDAENEVKGFQAGCSDFIRKPIQPLVTRARIHNHFALKRHTDLLKSLALMDGLTGIANRRHFENTLEMVWLQCIRDQVPISALFVDVDFFKKYNDRYGHPAGDKCLRHVAQTLKTCLRRPMDILARYGGEEFVCLLPNTEIGGAEHVAQSMVEQIRESHWPHEDGVDGTLSISVGSATLVPVVHQSWHELLEQADQHLYAAKERGRNQVVSSQTELSNKPDSVKFPGS